MSRCGLSHPHLPRMRQSWRAKFSGELAMRMPPSLWMNFKSSVQTRASSPAPPVGNFQWAIGDGFGHVRAARMSTSQGLDCLAGRGASACSPAMCAEAVVEEVSPSIFEHAEESATRK
jgi:hypothetical protein